MTNLTRTLADAQERHAQETAIVYRLYTEDKPGLVDLVKRYVPGATLFYGIGLYDGHVEAARVIEIVGTLADLQSIVHLAGDIRVTNAQTSVLVTWARVSVLNVTAPQGNS